MFQDPLVDNFCMYFLDLPMERCELLTTGTGSELQESVGCFDWGRTLLI